MYSKDEEKALKIEFWATLNEQLELERGLHASKVNWMNFNTKIKQLFFRMEASREEVKLCIDLQFLDPVITAIYYEQFTEFKNILEERLDGELDWQSTFEHTNGKTISRISVGLTGVDMYNKEDWPAMHGFLKQNFIKLENFWAEFSDVFVALKS
ncbi:MAG: hypothetical protein ACI8ZM_005180 [Crocinitomix sp.]|jgi:hypothetical protein